MKDTASPFTSPDLGVLATVVMGEETHAPRVAGDGRNDLRRIEDDLDKWYGTLISDLRIVSVWTFHVALYALQNPTPENIDRALELIGTSGDVDDAVDEETFLPLPVPLPPGFGYEGDSEGAYDDE